MYFYEQLEEQAQQLQQVARPYGKLTLYNMILVEGVLAIGILYIVLNI